ncbi:hypothetical protein BLNAU_12566 [Blattamonas nauphoetae]|uniref:Uncharacterized protein n=1 Tax=Blattamonas nauphoetae TaxID=2049346 RepID=A0ABQ9XLV4_9EUKA|nr:hypothetical protein BLNAU_12566 [Blattamonas nauphoetae]
MSWEIQEFSSKTSTGTHSGTASRISSSARIHAELRIVTLSLDLSSMTDITTSQYRENCGGKEQLTNNHGHVELENAGLSFHVGQRSQRTHIGAENQQMLD